MLHGIGGKFAQVFSEFRIAKPKPKEEEAARNLDYLSLDALQPEEHAHVFDLSTGYSHGATPFQDINFQSQSQLVNEYRTMAMHHDVDAAIDDIVNASITCEENEAPISLDLEGVEVGDAVKRKTLECWEEITEMMGLNDVAYERFRQWYVDGRFIYFVVVDEKKRSEGIKRLQILDPRATQRIQEVKREIVDGIERVVKTRSYFLYDPMFVNYNEGDVSSGNRGAGGAAMRLGGTYNYRLELSEDSVVQCHSGILSSDNSMVLGHLEKARKPLNNLRMIEDAVVVYRVTRAPERRVFYIDVGSLPPKSAEEYLQKIMNKYQTKVLYNPSTGRVEGKSHQVSMMEDYWLPRREGTQGTQIDTLQGGENLGQIEDMLYFQRKLFRSLNVPISRLEPDSGQVLFGGGRASEISRDEWKFNKFTSRLRRRYSMLPLGILKIQMVLKNVCTAEEWDELFEGKIKTKYASDGFAKEARELDELQQETAVLQAAEPFIGRFYSRDDILRRVRRLTDQDISKLDEDMQAEIKDGKVKLPGQNDDGFGDDDYEGGGFGGGTPQPPKSSDSEVD